MADEFARFNWIPAKTAAKMLEVSRQRVYKLIQEGKLGSVTMDGVFFVSRATVESRIIQLKHIKSMRANGWIKKKRYD